LNNTIPVNQRGKHGKGRGSVYSLSDSDSSNYHLTNIQIEFLPSLTTSLQPMDVVSNVEAELAQNAHSESIENEESEINKLVVDLTDPTIIQEVEAYKEINNAHITTEENLDDHQIVELMLVEQLEYKQ
ncbi:41860_t:CDS:2, partial [Gigaspora margarita]